MRNHFRWPLKRSHKKQKILQLKPVWMRKELGFLHLSDPPASSSHSKTSATSNKLWHACFKKLIIQRTADLRANLHFQQPIGYRYVLCCHQVGREEWITWIFKFRVYQHCFTSDTSCYQGENNLAYWQSPPHTVRWRTLLLESCFRTFFSLGNTNSHTNS